jgi:hypothetical protein
MSKIKERPIIFNSEMVKPILDGRKTQTRRVCKPQPVWWDGDYAFCGYDKNCPLTSEAVIKYCPYGKIGDRLWVREAHIITKIIKNGKLKKDVIYCNGVKEKKCEFIRTTTFKIINRKWTSPLFMPRWASRITLEITNIRVERLQEISAEDILKEGFEVYPIPLNFKNFKNLWNSIHKKEYCWESNPWVWVVEFRRVDV